MVVSILVIKLNKCVWWNWFNLLYVYVVVCEVIYCCQPKIFFIRYQSLFYNCLHLVGKLKGELKLLVLPMTILSICKLQTQVTLALFLKVLASNQDWKVQWEILDCEEVWLICWLSLLYIVCGQMKQTLINFCIKCNEEITCIHKIAVFCCAFCQ